MNEQAKEYWKDYWLQQQQEPPAKVTAWQFGADPDYLAEQVKKGIKSATCSAHVFYKHEEEPLPEVNDYSIVLNSKDKPVAIIRTTEVTLMPMNEVPESFARAEGEGDLSYEYWHRVHVEFFTKELAELGLSFSEDLLLVCERFELVNAK
ncbi:ASCH domain-containing protein [Chryseomicrobium sp. FSL W7-1435]|uniref:ASCH domain-containing protein n=1 Tax=Chryseomicrobium sp. FSL W7-1435 TaxID=2921704 RepID=UPI003159C7DE